MNCVGYLKVLDQHSGTNSKINHDNCSTAWDQKSVPPGYTSKVTPRLWERSLMSPFVHLFWNWRITDIHYGMHVQPFHCKGLHSLWWDCSRAVRGKIIVILNRPNHCVIFIVYAPFTNLVGASKTQPGGPRFGVPATTILCVVRHGRLLQIFELHGNSVLELSIDKHTKLCL